MYYFLDTNIFLRFFVKEDETSFHNCFRVIEKIQNNKLKAITTNLIIAELVWVLKSYYRLDKKEIIMFISAINSLNGLKLQDKFELPLSISYFKNHTVKFINSLIASIPQIQNKKWSIISYDKDFDNLGVKRFEPGQEK
ncbi:MAG TPA: PIN domain-containing protein [Candidatus Dojkabacteria bacterium]|nr:PIN domain-containing protein [Candidatus Dojkabacteria bacterium]